VKPLDRELFLGLLTEIFTVITVEDHALQGGFGSAFLEFLAEEGLTGIRIKRLGIPDRFIPHGTQEELRKMCGIDRDSIVQMVLQIMRQVKKRKKGGWERGHA